MAAPNTPVTFKPYDRKGEQLIAGIFDGRGMNITASEYHSVRQGIMDMRVKDPAAGALYDKYLTEVVGGKKTWSGAEMDKLGSALNKNNLGTNYLVNDIGKDLKAHGYRSSYNPPVAIDVNGRPMHPEVVAGELKAKGIEIKGDIPRSPEPGKVLGAMHVDAGDASRMVGNLATESTERGFKKTANILIGEIAEHAKRFGVIGKGVGMVAAGTMAFAGGANASEIASESLNAGVPGVGSLSKLVIGEGSKRGALCEAFGQVTGAGAGIGAGLGVGALTSWTGPAAVVAGGAAGIATEAATTPAATWACNKIAQKLGM